MNGKKIIAINYVRCVVYVLRVWMDVSFVFFFSFILFMTLVIEIKARRLEIMVSKSG